MHEFFQTLGSWSVTVFVVTSMLNAGLTQKPSRILGHLANRACLGRMLLLNLVVVPVFGGLSTVQRGTSAALVVAQDDFEDPQVLVVITLLTTLGVVLLAVAAKLMSTDNRFTLLSPVAADPPHRHPEQAPPKERA